MNSAPAQTAQPTDVTGSGGLFHSARTRKSIVAVDPNRNANGLLQFGDAKVDYATCGACFRAARSEAFPSTQYSVLSTKGNRRTDSHRFTQEKG